MQKTSIWKFLDRENELSVLQELIEEKGPGLIVIYGRRRVGKTMLIRELERHVSASIVYIVGRRETEKLLLERLGRICASVFGDEFLLHGGFASWDQFFQYIGSKASTDRVVLVFDEFPDMVYSSPSLPSVLREYWDNVFRGRDIKIFVIGSSISMMRKLFSSRESILYGRRTFELKVQPLDIIGAHEFLSTHGFNSLIRYYGIVGGTPAYLEIASRFELEDLVRYSLTKGSVLYEDGFTLITSEVEEPRIHYVLLSILGKGYRRLGAIASRAGVRLNILYKYISLLELLDIVGRKRNLVGRETYYYIVDPYFSWWINTVYDNIDLLEKGFIEPIYNRVLKWFNDYVSQNIVPIITEQLIRYVMPRKDLIDIGFILRKGIEFDYVLRYSRYYVIVETKWSDLSRRGAETIAYDVLGKAYSLKLENPKVIVISRSVDGEEKYYVEERNYVITTFNTLFKKALKGERLESLAID